MRNEDLVRTFLVLVSEKNIIPYHYSLLFVLTNSSRGRICSSGLNKQTIKQTNNTNLQMDWSPVRNYSLPQLTN